MPTARSSLLYSPDSPGQRPPQTETPWTDIPPEGTWDQIQRLPEGTVSQTGSDIIQNHPPPATPVNRMTNASKNMTLPQTPFAGGNNNILASLEHAKNSLMC